MAVRAAPPGYQRAGARRLAARPAYLKCGPPAAAVWLALRLRNLVKIGVDKNTTVVFPAPLMTAIAELGSFVAREQAASEPIPPPAATANGSAVS
jgi:hypothetical protein